MLICLLKPLERARIKAIPMIPILEAKAVKVVLHFLVMMFLKDNLSAVEKPIAVFFSL
ncbi:hypothetical protein D3C75_1233140 [compost metagenome]